MSSEERRQSNIEALLVEMGSLKEITRSTNSKVAELSEKVGIQNGRVGKLERWQSFLYGVSAILTLTIIPIAIRYFPDFISYILHK